MKYFVTRKITVMYFQKLVKFSDDMVRSSREPAYFGVSHPGGDGYVWIPRQDSSASLMCSPGTIQSSVPIFQEICLLQGPWKLTGIYFFNSISDGLFLRITVHQSSRSSVTTLLTGLPSLELETSGFQANPKPWGNLSGR